MPNPTPRQALAFLTLSFRPFFLGAALWSAAALALWIAMLMGGLTLPIRFDALTWHIHEMLFGFVLAVIAGFLLTAIPNWTGRPPIAGARLAALAMLWIAGRAAGLLGALIPLWLEAVVDIAFLVTLCVIAAREVIIAGDRRNLPIPLPIAALAVADLLMFLQAAGYAVPEGIGWRLGVASVITLISVIAGRITPTFTRNWLQRSGSVGLPPVSGAIDNLALGLLHPILLVWVVLPAFGPVGLLLLLAAVFHLARLLRWRGAATMREPLLFSLHIGYAWVVIGTALLGLSVLMPGFPEAAAIHAYTAGAIGTMVLAVMTRVSRGHTGRALAANPSTALLYLMVTLSALARVAAAFPSGAAPYLLDASAGLWIASFLLFVAGYGKLLLQPKMEAAAP